ncbi:MAG: Asp-tRNA(Asn)/Glu-tRNA(Gln) amidotransferase subunit GatB [Elusimicrobiaceae bacterium]|nr:Asp-tRNA(Asn)/Glu-tRNA(Gln) amidotransferase subunit GatB [Elusimicrobiaceae bacterium]
MPETVFEPVIGLEIHVQLNTATKLFCGCAADSAAAPNTNICPVCTGQPGSLPVLNRKAVELAVRAAAALDCEISERSVFSRKNYFYPDCPRNYQISQYDKPLALRGRIRIETGPAEHTAEKIIGITRVHVEDDAGKSLHAIGSAELDYTLVDFNRAGVPLIEIVSEPDMRSPDEAYSYLAALKNALVWSGVSSCDMEKGELRVDVNLSLRPAGQERFGTKVELKNLNSFKAVKDALHHEITRQAAVLNSGGIIMQETRLWDEKAGQTVLMRIKEDAHDYRYFPEPDLVPLAPAPGWVAEIKAALPELPQARRARFIRDYALGPYDAGVLLGDRATGDYFEAVMRAGKLPAKTAANWIGTNMLAKLNSEKLTAAGSKIRPEALAELLALIEAGRISATTGKEVFERMWATGKAAADIVAESGLAQVSDDGALRDWAKAAIAANPKAVEDLKSGNEKAISALVGFIMRQSKGKANPGLANKIIRELTGRA